MLEFGFKPEVASFRDCPLSFEIWIVILFSSDILKHIKYVSWIFLAIGKEKKVLLMASGQYY